MSAISTILARLRAAIWAIDVRDDIANAIEQCYSDVSNPTLKTEALEAALQNKIDEGEMAALTIGDHTITAAKLAQGVIDNTLATSGAAADAKKTGDELTAIKADLDAKVTTTSVIHPKYPLGAIVDSAGNVINGVPVTEFDKAYDDVKQYNIMGKRISILGDSISTYDGVNPTGYEIYYPRGDIDDVSKTWWSKVLSATGAILGTNASWSGSRVSGNLNTDTSAKPGCGNQRIADLALNGTPDIIFTYISTNDWAAGVDIGHFGPTDPMPVDGNITTIAYAYALMLYKIRTTYPNAVVFCITSTFGRTTVADQDQQHPWLNVNGETLHELNHELVEIAHMFGCKSVDLETCGIHPWNVSSYTVDGKTHPNNAGTTLIANAVLKELKNWFGR